MNTSPDFRRECMERLMTFVRSLVYCSDDCERDRLVSRFRSDHGRIALREALNVERGVRSGKYKLEQFQ